MIKDMSATGCDMSFYGTATVGERGQLVIPAEARQQLGIHPGDKVLIFRHPAHKGLMMFKLDSARAFLDELSAMVNNAETHVGGPE
ncbi:MAG: AbrB/MazE/SpoVT family DNA-binding domain-containing protein [Fimbriimonas ginsengisoli]|uniref:AbrB/MazE/SpoVT family DNA-binding domain-containing protein n=1 Tax=Fimbriimonas ginsengisoli TaxID=1005039 RepID=A0A931LWL7_FIMGI|nr:AbrB/MazE/SpoVT family DNA-binding domain-containing protein [Fimbriimonas ginsengisoli]